MLAGTKGRTQEKLMRKEREKVEERVCGGEEVAVRQTEVSGFFSPERSRRSHPLRALGLAEDDLLARGLGRPAAQTNLLGRRSGMVELNARRHAVRQRKAEAGQPT